MSRAAIFDAVKAALGRPWSQGDVAILDTALDALGVPAGEAPSRLEAKEGALALIRRFEGCRLKAYPDPASGGDPWTIGWGSTGPGIRPGVIWTQAQADRRLEQDVAAFADGVARLVGAAATTQGEYDALVSFAYNVGFANLAGSTLLKLHKAGDKAGAAAQFGRWNRARGEIMPGLTRRREAEAKAYRGAA
jgi:lysozyme